MKVFLLIPIIAYIFLAFFNLDLVLNSYNNINIFNVWEFNIPALLYSSMYFILYVILLFVIYDLKGVLTKRKIEKLENEIFSLKSRLYDEREDELKKFISEYKTRLEDFTTEQKSLFEKFKAENEIDLVKQKAETDRILDKLNLLDKSIFDKIKESFKNKN